MAKGNHCYYCGEQLRRGKNGNRRIEHVPPKMLFGAFQCDSITVPSCPLHNTSKSDQDQAILAGFLKALDTPSYNLHPDVIKAIQYENVKSTYKTTKNTAKKIPFFKNPVGIFANLPDVTYSTAHMHAWIRQLTAGLVYDATKRYDPTIDWDQAVPPYSPNYYPSDGKGFSEEQGLEMLAGSKDSNESLKSHPWWAGWSAHPRPYPSNIFRFFVWFDKLVAFRFVFYNSFNWYIAFECSKTTRQLLERKIIETNRS